MGYALWAELYGFSPSPHPDPEHSEGEGPTLRASERRSDSPVSDE